MFRTHQFTMERCTMYRNLATLPGATPVPV